MSVNDFWAEMSFAQRNMAYAVRGSRVGEAGFLSQIREAVWSVNPDVPIANVQMLDEILDESMSRTSFTLVMLVIASGVALLIGAVGLYGVISYGVTQRTREIGVRMALGARTSDVSGMFLRHAALLSGIGIAVGLVGAFGLTQLMSSLLVQREPRRSYDLRAGLGRAGRDRANRELHPRAARIGHRPDAGPSLGVISSARLAAFRSETRCCLRHRDRGCPAWSPDRRPVVLGMRSVSQASGHRLQSRYSWRGARPRFRAGAAARCR